MTTRQRQSTFALNIAKLIIKAYELGYELTLGEAWRPLVTALFYTGKYNLTDAKTGKIALTGAKRGIEQSLHRMKCAVDINLFKDGEYLQLTSDHKELGSYWESLHENNRWGGRYNDGNHYEMLKGRR